MGVAYKGILWNKHKKNYDLVIWAYNIAFLAISFTLNTLLFPQANPVTTLIRSFGLLSIVLLHIILAIGPLCRINTKLLPILYNRRHLGVSMFSVASVHAMYSIFWFHDNGNIHPLLSLFTSNIHYNSFLFFPFQTLGFAAYIILLLMAATSHDFWLSALKPKFWKTLHMLVYVAYFLLILHIALGVLQLENHFLVYGFLLLGVIFLAIIHIWAGYLVYQFDTKKIELKDGWQYVCNIDEIEDNKAKMVNLGKERIAVFKYQDKLSAVHNVCKHQNGPLGEGKIIDGCITCPWHGYQYQPQDGCSPAPFTEKVATYRLQLEGTKIYVNPNALEEGTFVEPIKILATNSTANDNGFYIGWANKMDSKTAKAIRLFTFPAMLIGVLFLISFTLTQNKLAFVSYTDEEQIFTGTLSNTPFPNITVITKDTYGNPVMEIFPLVNVWKFGADQLISDWCGKNENCVATLKANIIKRDGVKVLVLDDGKNAFQQVKNVSLPLPITSEFLGEREIKGEIIDPKCYLGAMNPGEGKPHRSCAIRCISGGVMPMLNYKENGKIKYAVLLGDHGEKINQEVLDYVAEPVLMRGKLYKYGNWQFMYINVKNIKRLGVE